MALLAKQGWRVTTRHDTLLHQVFRQRYFPGSNFFAAHTGTTLSYTWRSMLRSRDLLIAGTRWQIGDGKSAIIIDQPWLPHSHTFQLIVKPRTLNSQAKVADLIDLDRGWKVDLIRHEFIPEDAESVLSIPLKENNQRDEIVWHYEKKDTFLVRSAYNLAATLNHASCSKIATAELNIIWKARVPPKIQMFAWRCALNALPTLDNLRRRGVGLDVCCSCCGGELEDLTYVLFQCTFSRLVWALTNLPWSIISEQGWNGGRAVSRHMPTAR
ncbi:UNVERIFIED_CONTAM: hypothetical protein Slati_0434000 [Sesamum latifolium]|uniref:Reverse transcriptase zinc-binding domain-containing protein n=1 Tax=Sesamum latifolium TaxID=2727402 RepID=A0AAW2XVC8_9LAMI